MERVKHDGMGLDVGCSITGGYFGDPSWVRFASSTTPFYGCGCVRPGGFNNGKGTTWSDNAGDGTGRREVGNCGAGDRDGTGDGNGDCTGSGNYGQPECGRGDYSY